MSEAFRTYWVESAVKHGQTVYFVMSQSWARPTDEGGTARAAWNVYVKESE